ncbi:MAG: excinuclease ABC subunit UvrC [Candidatus Eiseniibacteriota bacterium]
MPQDRVRTTLERLPPSPGCYLFKNRQGRIIYVGKAKRLDSRVRSYFQAGRIPHPRTDRLVRLVDDVDVIVTGSEAEALILEATLVREHQPLFNVRLKDDKTFPWVKLSVQETYPRLTVTRQVLDDGARYFGPFTDVSGMRRTLRFLRQIFPIRTCANIEPYLRADRPCLNYHIRRCAGPCYSASGVTAEDHRRLVERFALLLSGKDDEVRSLLASDMARAAGERRYEDAATVRDQMALLDRLSAGQKILGPGAYDADAIGLAREGDRAVIAVLHVREGRVTGQDSHALRGVRGQTEERVLHEFILQHYLRAEAWPEAIWLTREPADAETLAQALRSQGRPIALEWAKRARARTLLDAAAENARLALEVALARQGGRTVRYQPGVYELQSALGLERPPFRVVCFDISNIQGAEPVASVTVMENGQAKRSDYRRMRMRTPGPDDFAMMREAVTRYFTRVAGGTIPTPDLVVVDGGVGQVGAALEALEETGCAALPLVGLAKREEEIVRVSGEVLRLPRRSPALRGLMRLRDEAHRFAITYHRKLRTRRTVKSVLDDVPGIGPARRRALLGAFGSVAELVQADAETIAARARVPRAVAERVLTHLAATKGEPGPANGSQSSSEERRS